ncbi:unnamed protein product [Sphenostylis stenocarpa]|uniref:Uncharacterized protein n=1 Tax=Sphenostylis stenocarpa TaxID=92480 RepID=A0AA86VKP1_9FABA|nr:unnamed protein product [Sphenostylis stenocarpa]
MAQTMLLMSSVPASYAIDLKRDTMIQLQNQISKPKFSQYIFFNPLPSSPTFTTFALYKTKTKAPLSKVVKSNPKPKVEDGVFGTSGGFGFTKQNELFVGRVAMLGFAVSHTYS